MRGKNIDHLAHGDTPTGALFGKVGVCVVFYPHIDLPHGLSVLQQCCNNAASTVL
jgi:hypothetical protein